MSNEIHLPKTLRRARKARGWSIYQASKRMNGIFPNSLRTLEGQNPDRDPGGDDCKLRTVLEIIRVYWPDVTLDDFTESVLLFKVVPKNLEDQRELKGYLADTG